MQSMKKSGRKKEEKSNVISIQKLQEESKKREAQRKEEPEIEEQDLPVRKAEKTPRQKQEERRFLCTLFMALCLIFLSGWCLGRTIRDIRSAGEAVSVSELSKEVVEENTKKAGEKLDVDALAKKLLAQVSFAAELNPLDDSVAEGMIVSTPGTKLQVYMGNGTYADELVIMTAASEEDAEKNQENVKTHLAEMRKQFAQYIPQEVTKIDNAVQVRSGSYVIVCVSSDADTAREIIDSFMKK